MALAIMKSFGEEMDRIMKMKAGTPAEIDLKLKTLKKAKSDYDKALVAHRRGEVTFRKSYLHEPCPLSDIKLPGSLIVKDGLINCYGIEVIKIVGFTYRELEDVLVTMVTNDFKNDSGLRKLAKDLEKTSKCACVIADTESCQISAKKLLFLRWSGGSITLLVL